MRVGRRGRRFVPARAGARRCAGKGTDDCVHARLLAIESGARHDNVPEPHILTKCAPAAGAARATPAVNAARAARPVEEWR